MPNDPLNPYPIDDGSTVAYIRLKLPEWHTRLRTVEDKLEVIDHKLDRVVSALTGSEDGSRRGYNVRLEIMEGFKRTMSWAIGVLYVATISSLVGLIFALITR